MAPVETLEQQVKDLKERVKQLESRVGGLDARTIGMVRLGQREREAMAFDRESKRG